MQETLLTGEKNMDSIINMVISGLYNSKIEALDYILRLVIEDETGYLPPELEREESLEEAFYFHATGKHLGGDPEEEEVEEEAASTNRHGSKQLTEDPVNWDPDE